MMRLRLTVLQFCVVFVTNNKPMIYNAQRELDADETAAKQEEKEKLVGVASSRTNFAADISSRAFSGTRRQEWVLGLHRWVLVPGRRAAVAGRD